MKKNVLIIVVVLVIIVFGVGIGTYFYVKSNIPTQKLVATFHGGSSEVTYESEIYKIDNGHANMGFTYINYECTTKRWGSKESTRKVIGKGEFTWTDGAFEVAKNNNAYSYVTVPGSDKTYSIEEFSSIFLMD